MSGGEPLSAYFRDLDQISVLVVEEFDSKKNLVKKEPNLKQKNQKRRASLSDLDSSSELEDLIETKKQANPEKR